MSNTTGESTKERPHPRNRREAGSEAHAAHIAQRRTVFTAIHDLSIGRGLELGPLDTPITDGALHDVRYVDVHDAEGVRAKYQNDPNVLVDFVPHIDFPLIEADTGRVRSLVEAASADAPYDWVVASHVIEHVPDVIGWLEEIAELTTEGGALVLAVPDRRYCFDRHRPPTTVGQMIQARESKDVRPSIRAIYDATAAAVTVNTRALHRGARPPGREALMATKTDIGHVLQQWRDGQYIDCHSWTFTPQSFLEQIKELRALGLCTWYVEVLTPTPRRELEFHAVLRRLPRGTDVASADIDEPELESDLPDWLEDEWAMADRYRQSRAEAKELRSQVKSLERANRRLVRRLAALESSASMRVGRTIVAPGRAVRNRLRSRS